MEGFGSSTKFDRELSLFQFKLDRGQSAPWLAPGWAPGPGSPAGAPRAGSEDLLKKHIFGVKNENRRFGAIFGRVWLQLGQNRNQREKLVI